MDGRGSGPTVLECAVAHGGTAGRGQPCAPGLRNAGFCEVPRNGEFGSNSQRLSVVCGGWGATWEVGEDISKKEYCVRKARVHEGLSLWGTAGGVKRSG